MIGIEYGEDGMPFAESPPPIPPQGQETPAPQASMDVPAVGLSEEQALQQAAQQAFAPPRGPWEYEFPMLNGASDQEVILQAEVRNALYAEQIPAHLVSLAREIGEYNIKAGPLSEESLETSRLSGLAELQRRHGANAEAVIAKAKKEFDKLDARSPETCDWLVDTGVASSADFVEALARLHDNRRQ
jgi:hypothetical protein